MARKNIGIIKPNYQYIACPKCHKLYLSSSLPMSNCCTHVEYPEHPQDRLRQECRTSLVKKVNIQKGVVMKLILIYPITSIKQQLCNLFKREDFEQSMRKWKDRKIGDGVLSDIYEGKIWREFCDVDNKPFFTSSKADTHLGLMLNLDWFNPFD